MKTVGVVIGRFQLPQLHEGHLALIVHVMKQTDVACVLVGVGATNLKNMLPYPAVSQMIRREFPATYAKGELQIHPLLDIPGEDLQWSLSIDRFLQALYPQHDIQLWTGRDSFKPHYHGKYRPVLDWYGFNGEINGTIARDAIINGDPIDSPVFRAGIIYGLGNYLREEE